MVKDVFEIKPQYNTGHDTGVVVVLDRLVADSPDALIGLVAQVRIPEGRTFQVKVDDARYHGTANGCNRVSATVFQGFCRLV